MPVLDERWIGAAGFATTCNGVPCKTRELIAKLRV